jgi:hypothetical protein
MSKFGFSKWSWKRAFGFSNSKRRLSRTIGIPLTKEGRLRWKGRMWDNSFGCMAQLILLFFLLILCGVVV